MAIGDVTLGEAIREHQFAMTGIQDSNGNGVTAQIFTNGPVGTYKMADTDSFAVGDFMQLRAGVAGTEATINFFDASTSTFSTVMIFDQRQFVSMLETSDPGVSGPNSGRIYMRDNGAGKTQLVVQFNTGAVQVIATEP